MLRSTLSLGACLLVGACYSGLSLDSAQGGGSSDPDAPPDGGETSGGVDSDDTDGGEPSDDTDGDPACVGMLDVSSRLRRMTRSAYEHTVRDLLGAQAGVADHFEADEVTAGFRNNSINPVSQVTVEDYLRAAEEISAAAVTDVEALVGCAPADGETCAEDFIVDFGRRAWRRPLSSDEVDLSLQVFRGGDGFADGIRLVLQALLQSPYFIYHFEFGTADVAEDGTVELSQFEVASRLSYLLWDSTPDDELLDAAEAGELSTTAQRRAQAERMLADPKARDAIASFHRQWLTMPDYELEAVDKDPELYPEFDEGLRSAMAREIELRSDYIIRHGGGSLEELAASPTTIVDAQLAELYGVDLVADAVDLPGTEELPEGFVAVNLDPQQRGGLLTQAGILATLGTPSNSNIPLRGMFVSQNLLCTTIAEPPPDLELPDLPEADPEATAREKLETETSVVPCAGCHSVINPLGFALENYGALGEYREEDAFGHPIDASATVLYGEIAGDYTNATELATALASSDDFRGCVSEHWFKFAFGRELESDGDVCAYEAMHTAFADSDYDVRELLMSIVTSGTFNHLQAEQ